VFSFGMSIPLTLWDKKKGPIATATAEQERAMGELEKLRQEILGRVTTAQQNLAAVKETLTNYTPEFLGRLKAALEAASQSYGEGRTPLLLFLETQRTYFETQASYFESLERLYESQAELESAVGVPLQEISQP
jgi:cobalt-zinc-cadmium efflux system outer membrane protein